MWYGTGGRGLYGNLYLVARARRGNLVYKQKNKGGGQRLAEPDLWRDNGGDWDWDCRKNLLTLPEDFIKGNGRYSN